PGTAPSRIKRASSTRPVPDHDRKRVAGRAAGQGSSQLPMAFLQGVLERQRLLDRRGPLASEDAGPAPRAPVGAEHRQGTFALSRGEIELAQELDTRCNIDRLRRGSRGGSTV